MSPEKSTFGGDPSVEELRGELAAAREQQAATSEILRLISGSPTDLQRVFTEVAAAAARLCDAYDAGILHVTGDYWRIVAHHGPIPITAQGPLTRGLPTGRAVLDRLTLHIGDLQAETDEYPEGSEFARRLGYRTMLCVPLLRAGEAIGVIFTRRTEVRPFTNRQIELVETFADQAVIAIENTRLFEAEQASKRELQESLEYQTATGEVLSVISRSPNELQPVLDAITQTAARLCQADYAHFRLLRDGAYHVASSNNYDPLTLKRLTPIAPGPGSITGRVALECKTVHLPDILTDATGDYSRQYGEVARAGLGVPLMKDGTAVGVIMLFRKTVRPFTERQIALVNTFAEQALIAMENTRLFEAEQASKRDLQESLEYQTAISEVLGVISRSPTDAQPVFDSIAQSATQLCGAQHCNVFRFDGRLIHFAATHLVPEMPPGAREANMKQPPIAPGRGNAAARSIACATVAEIPDIDADPDYERRDVTTVSNLRSTLGVPMLKDSTPIGAIVVSRLVKGRFSERQVKLLQTFADQAAIAIENARLFEAEQASKCELRESLQQQTATAEVLKVISRATFDLPKVLDTLVESAATLCDSHDTAIVQMDGDVLRIVSHRGNIPSIGPIGEATLPVTRGASVGRAVLDRQTIHLADAQSETDEYPEGSAIARRLGFRTILTVPLLVGSEAVGAITLRRSEVRPFTDRQIELLQTFADQAVIAIENARLFEAERARTRELTESLEHQTATGAILRAIAASPTDIGPVLQVVVETAGRLCEADDVALLLRAGNLLQLRAHHGPIPIDPENRPISRDWATGRAVVDRRTIHVPDLVAAGDEFPVGRAIAVRLEYRGALIVPLMRRDTAIGAIALRRKEMRPFSEKQIALLETFADQAVIAIENTRLFEAEQASKRELQESLDQQTATSQVLEVISRSPGDLEQVFNIMLSSATRICDANFGNMYLRDGELYRLTASHNTPPVLLEHRKRVPLQRPTSVFGRMVSTKTLAHVADLMADPTYAEGEPEVVSAVELGGIRTIVMVPMLKEDQLIGALTLYRQEVRPFSEKQIDLVTNFAKQAVIAIENTRLLNELRESLQQQTTTADVLKVISRSTFDLQPVLEALIKEATKLCAAEQGFIFRWDGELYHLAADYNAPAGFREWAQRRGARPGDGSVVGRVSIEDRTIQILDAQADAAWRTASAEAPGTSGIRTLVGVPMRREGILIGVIAMWRTEIRPFTAKQLALVETFANQAVIAIENTRLLNELRESLQQQTATADVLSVISRSPTDALPVFDTIAERAEKLCDADISVVSMVDGELIRLVAIHGTTKEGIASVQAAFPMHMNNETVTARVIRTCAIVHVADVLADLQYEMKDAARMSDYRSVLGIPMIRERKVIGSISVGRRKPGLFVDAQVELLKTFADQAVIAIENTRLFEEVQARNRDLTALGEVGRAVSSTLDLKVVLKTIVDRAVELSGTDAGSIFYYREQVGRFELGETAGLDDEVVARLRKLDISSGQTGLSEAIAKREPLQAADIIRRPSNPLRDTALEAGLHAALIVPLLGSERPLGALVLQRQRPGEFTAAVVSLMQAFADQSAIALENARLLRRSRRRAANSKSRASISRSSSPT
jgi:GAF domain-containing protein